MPLPLLITRTWKEPLRLSNGSFKLTLGITKKKIASILSCAIILLLVRKALKSHMYETKQNRQIYLNRTDYHITGMMKLIIIKNKFFQTI